MRKKQREQKNRKRILVLCMLAMIFLLAGCSKKKATISCLEDLKNDSYTIAMAADISMEATAKELCPDCEIRYIESVNFIEPLKSGMIDACIMGREQLTPIVEQYRDEGFYMLEEPVHSYKIVLALSKDYIREGLLDEVNACIRRYKDEGILDEMMERWNGENPEKEVFPQPENPSYTLKVTTCGEIKPYTYFKNNELVGLDIELVEHIASDLGYGVEWTVADFPAMLAGLDAGKYDMIASNLFETGERGEAFLFSESYQRSDIMMAVLNKELADSYQHLDDLKNARVFATNTGSIHADIIREHFPQAEIKEFSGLMDEIIALQSGKVDAFLYDEPVLTYTAAENPDLKVLPELLLEEDYYFCTAKNEHGNAVAADINQWIAEAKASGLLEELQTFWVGNEAPEGRCDFSSLSGENGVLSIGVVMGARPAVYMFENKPVGLPLDIMYFYCKDRGYVADVQIMDFSAFSVALNSGKVDLFADYISYTEERAESLIFTEPFYSGGVAAIVRSDAAMGSGSADGGFFSDLKENFEKTLIREDRWKMVVSGLAVTLAITAGGFVLSNLFGALFCYFRMSGSRFLWVLADIYSRIMQGTPMVVVLMILYYIILGKTTIGGVPVAILGFGLVSGAGLAQSFEGAIRSIDRGQTEAALALGFSRTEAFLGIVFPQAGRSILPGYFSELISLMKSTSIVGYIAVTDLTKSSDIIRGSTFEAFFPLISIAVIYFVIVNILLSIMRSIQKSLAPKRVTGKEAEK